MINITIPNNNINERKYIIDILFNEFLGLKYKLAVSNEPRDIIDWIIELENGNQLIFEDHFFNKFPNDLEYLKFENIPSIISYQQKTKNKYIVEDDIPVLYGSSNLKLKTSVSKLQSSNLTCGIDIFASSFFMLTRWEEYVNKNRDIHNRFSASESLAFNNNFLDRPIVNEYVEMLWDMFVYLDINQKRKTRNYQLFLTHDVDVPLKYTNWKGDVRRIAGDILKRKDAILAIKNSTEQLLVRLGLNKDPFDTFDYLMDKSEKVGVKSFFFFMGKGITNFDNAYESSDKFIEKLVKNIKKRGHHIGIHPSYSAYNNNIQFKKEKNELEKNLQTKILYGREHFLRFEVPTTWQIWEDNGMEWDSTLAFADKEGFRCGTCYEYSVFNICTQQKLKLKEKPLIVMEGNFTTYQTEVDLDTMQDRIIALIDKVKKYQGNFIYLWHNSRLESEQYINIYEKTIHYSQKDKK